MTKQQAGHKAVPSEPQEPYGAHLDAIALLQPGAGGLIARTRDGFELHVKTRRFARPDSAGVFATGALRMRLWPRTNEAGLLVPSTQAYRLTPIDPSEAELAHSDTFTVRGNLIRHHPQRRSAVILIRRNQRGNLRREFYLTLTLTNRINRHLSRYPSSEQHTPGAALILTGTLQHGYLRTKDITPTHLQEPKRLKRHLNSPS